MTPPPASLPVSASSLPLPSMLPLPAAAGVCLGKPSSPRGSSPVPRLPLSPCAVSPPYIHPHPLPPSFAYFSGADLHPGLLSAPSDSAFSGHPRGPRAPAPRAVVPNLFATRDQFCGRQFFHVPGWRVCFWNDSSAFHSSSPPVVRLSS